jgi:putative oxidoreductase
MRRAGKSSWRKTAPEGGPVEFLEKLRPFTLLVVRCAVGAIFMAHGYQKYSHGFGATDQFMAGVGLPAYFGYIAIALELGGGALLILGLLTRPLGLLLAIEMVVAIVKVHLGGGITNIHSYEFPLALGVASLALGTFGAGAVSLDALLFGRSFRPKSKPKP